ncbi:uncharacterized protein DS421_15g509010 [Arachis hypogaea]|nr:uncharacterized protein DS421_15g509010 [Arachis hypogaea]
MGVGPVLSSTHAAPRLPLFLSRLQVQACLAFSSSQGLSRLLLFEKPLSFSRFHFFPCLAFSSSQGL